MTRVLHWRVSSADEDPCALCEEIQHGCLICLGSEQHPCFKCLIIFGHTFQIIGPQHKIFAFYKRRESHLVQSSLIERAAKLVTRSSITITSIFVITYGYIAIYVIIVNIGLVPFELGVILYRIVSYFVVCFNSTVNPFIYAMMIPLFRRNLSQLFYRCIRWRQKTPSSQETGNHGLSVVATVSAPPPFSPV